MSSTFSVEKELGIIGSEFRGCEIHIFHSPHFGTKVNRICFRSELPAHVLYIQEYFDD